MTFLKLRDSINPPFREDSRVDFIRDAELPLRYSIGIESSPLLGKKYLSPFFERKIELTPFF